MDFGCAFTVTTLDQFKCLWIKYGCLCVCALYEQGCDIRWNSIENSIIKLSAKNKTKKKNEKTERIIRNESCAVRIAWSIIDSSTFIRLLMDGICIFQSNRTFAHPCVYLLSKNVSFLYRAITHSRIHMNAQRKKTRKKTFGLYRWTTSKVA